MARPPPLASPDHIEATFYEAMQRGDIELMMAIWSDDDEIACVHPGGARVVGAAAVRASFEAIFGNGAVPVVPERVRRLQTHDCAMHSVLERVQVMTEQGPRSAYAIATNVYMKGALGWRMVAHHASPGSLSDEADERDAQTTIH